MLRRRRVRACASWRCSSAIAGSPLAASRGRLSIVAWWRSVAVLPWRPMRASCAAGAKPFPAAPDSDLPTVLKALYLQRTFTRFAIDAAGRRHDAASRSSSTTIRRSSSPTTGPTISASPTQAPGVIRGCEGTMSRALDLADIQGNILRAYGKLGFPKARFIFFTSTIRRPGAGSCSACCRGITTAVRWPIDATPIAGAGRAAVKPEGGRQHRLLVLRPAALEVPTRTLRGMPDEFIDGMEKRAPMLGDILQRPTGAAGTTIWTAIGRHDRSRSTSWISLNAQMDADGTPVAELEAQDQWLIESAVRSPTAASSCCRGTDPPSADYQELSAIMRRTPDGKAGADRQGAFRLHRRHRRSGVRRPVSAPRRAAGDRERRRKLDAPARAGRRWRPASSCSAIRTRRRRSPARAMPLELQPQRHLHGLSQAAPERRAVSTSYIDARQGATDRQTCAASPTEARRTLRAKMVGRWDDGVPLMVAPTTRAAAGRRSTPS